MDQTKVVASPVSLPPLANEALTRRWPRSKRRIIDIGFVAAAALAAKTQINAASLVIETGPCFVSCDSGPVVGCVVQPGEPGRSLRVQRRGWRRSFRPPLTSIHFQGLARLLAAFRLAGLRHGNRDGLFAAFHFAAGAALEVPFLVFVHYLLDFSFL